MKTVKVLTIAAVAILAAFVSATARVMPRFSGSAVTPPIAEGPSPQRLDPSFADSLLIIGTANNGAASQFGQLNAFGNGRSGSVADPGRTLGSTRETEWALEDALKSRDPLTDIHFAAEANYFQLNKSEYFVPITIKISGSQLPDSENTRHIFLDIIGQVNQDGVVAQKLRDEVDVRLSDEMARGLPMRQIAYDTGFTLFPGRYSIKFLVHEWNTGRIGTYQTVLLIPNLLKEDKNLPISSVVLSNEFVNLEDAVSNSMQPRSFPADGQFAVDPLVIEGKKLIPRVTREFSKRRDLLVFLLAYEPNAMATQPLTAFVTLYRGQTKMYETSPITFKDDLAQRLRAVPIELRVPLTNLPLGSYDCQVTVLDPTVQKSASWRSPISVVD